MWYVSILLAILVYEVIANRRRLAILDLEINEPFDWKTKKGFANHGPDCQW